MAIRSGVIQHVYGQSQIQFRKCPLNSSLNHHFWWSPFFEGQNIMDDTSVSSPQISDSPAPSRLPWEIHPKWTHRGDRGDWQAIRKSMDGPMESKLSHLIVFIATPLKRDLNSSRLRFKEVLLMPSFASQVWSRKMHLVFADWLLTLATKSWFPGLRLRGATPWPGLGQRQLNLMLPAYNTKRRSRGVWIVRSPDS